MRNISEFYFINHAPIIKTAEVSYRYEEEKKWDLFLNPLHEYGSRNRMISSTNADMAPGALRTSFHYNHEYSWKNQGSESIK